jgi:phosphate transport system permease protein
VSAHGEAIGRAGASRRAKDIGFQALLLFCIGLSVVLLGVLLVDIVIDGAGGLTWDFINNFTSIDAGKAGIQAALWGTIWLMGVCAAFVIPVGVATAIYLEEYADNTRWYNRFIEVNIQNLAAVPSIVYGILGLAFLVRGPVDLGPIGTGQPTVMAGGLTLGLLVLPVVIIAGREAIRAVPPSIREGSMALGATQWQDRAPDRGGRRDGDRIQSRRPRLGLHGHADPDLRLDQPGLERRQQLCAARGGGDPPADDPADRNEQRRDLAA